MQESFLVNILGRACQYPSHPRKMGRVCQVVVECVRTLGPQMVVLCGESL